MSAAKPTTRPRTKRAACVTLAVFAVSVFVLVSMFDQPLVPTWMDTDARKDRAALAVRDRVVPFQMWGSMVFTRPHLERAYGSFYYLEQFNDMSRRQMRTVFVRELEKALENHAQVDLFLISHSNRYYQWVAALPPELRKRLRLVYNTGCSNLDQATMWRDLGADVYIGHPGTSASPVFYFYFLRRWARGQSASEATEASNALMKQLLFRVLPLTAGLLKPDVVWADSKATLDGDTDAALKD